MSERLRAPADPDLLTIHEVADDLGLSRTTVMRLIKEGYLRSLPGLPKRHIIPRSSLEAFKRGESAGTNGSQS